MQVYPVGFFRKRGIDKSETVEGNIRKDAYKTVPVIYLHIRLLYRPAASEIRKIDRKAIEQCDKLKVITRPGVGYDSVDVEAATERGIPVVLCPSANARAVAEATLTLMFACAKNLVESVTETRKGNFNIRNKYAAVDIVDKKMVLLGFGHIGKLVAELCAALSMKIGVYDPYVAKDAVEAMGYTYYAELNDALADADFVSLHMPSTPTTRGMISTEQFKAMKNRDAA